MDSVDWNDQDSIDSINKWRGQAIGRVFRKETVTFTRPGFTFVEVESLRRSILRLLNRKEVLRRLGRSTGNSFNPDSSEFINANHGNLQILLQKRRSRDRARSKG